jgi:diacylglycerol kinase (ATP)
MPRAVIVCNPRAGWRGGRPLSPQRIAEALRARGIEAAEAVTRGPRDAARLAARAADSGADVVVVRGGDGTADEALQALVDRRTALAVWPAGTANVLARELGMPRAPERLAEVVARGRTRTVSVGRAGARVYLLMAGVGADAAVVQRVRPALKRWTGQGAYFAAAFGQLVRWPPPSFLVDADGAVHEAVFAVIANAEAYGGGFRFAPTARMDDSLLDLCLLGSASRLGAIRFMAAARFGAHVGLPGVTLIRARGVRAWAEGPGPAVQVDGELAGHLPMTFECRPAALSLVVP